jgi:hypothetical protein
MAIVPTSAQINIAHVRRGVGARPEVVFCDSYRKEGSDAEALARLRKELKLDEYRCTTLLKFADYKMQERRALVDERRAGFSVGTGDYRCA